MNRLFFLIWHRTFWEEQLEGSVQPINILPEGAGKLFVTSLFFSGAFDALQPN